MAEATAPTRADHRLRAAIQLDTARRALLGAAIELDKAQLEPAQFKVLTTVNALDDAREELCS